MKLSDLKALGAFVDGTPVQKKVKIGDTETEVGVVKLSFAEAMKIQDDEKLLRYPNFIAKCIVFEGGEKMTYAQACKLDTPTVQAFLEAIGEVNGTAPKDEAEV